MTYYNLVANSHGMTRSYRLRQSRVVGKRRGAGMLRTRWSNWPFETYVSNKQLATHRPETKSNTILCYLAPTHVWIHTFADTLPSVTAVVHKAGGLMSSKLNRTFGDVTVTINVSVWIFKLVYLSASPILARFELVNSVLFSVHVWLSTLRINLSTYAH